MKKIKNAFTDEYTFLKKEVLSSNFPWYWNEATIDGDVTSGMENTPHFGHVVVKRPRDFGDDTKCLFPKVLSQYSEMCNLVLNQIFDFNNIEVNCVYRISFNLTLPLSDKPIPKHYDHNFPHKNLLIYFNDSDGDTVCLNPSKKTHSPKEDDIIIFEGLHYHYLPTKGRRTVLVATFI